MTIKLGIIGLSEGNGHPYSWSAIFNGYKKDAMEGCGYPVIPRYLEEQHWPDVQIEAAEVVSVWTQDKALSSHIAEAALIPHISHTLDELSETSDAILLARDDAENHLEYAKHFLDKGMPVYIDKPITLSITELDKLYDLQQYEGQIFSCSALRYARELQLSSSELNELGEIRRIEASIPKDWARYAVHVIEPVLKLIGEQGTIIEHQAWCHQEIRTNHYIWDSGLSVSISTLGSLPSPISIRVIGEKGWKDLSFADTFNAFKSALEDFIEGILCVEQRTEPAFMRRVVEMIELGM